MRRLEWDGFCYIECHKCGYWYAPGPQENDCPHRKVEHFANQWPSTPLDWLPTFGASWMSDAILSGTVGEESTCICFGPPVDDCPIHGKKRGW
jgi:hypothetical protein